jgi:hypothetical protein
MRTRRALTRAFLAAFIQCLLAANVTSLAQDAAPHIQIELTTPQEQYRNRIMRAATESLTQLSIWLGPFPTKAVTIRSVGTRDAGNAANGVVDVTLPWQSAPSSMDVEAQVAFAIALQYWPHEPDGAGIAAGLANYLQRRIVERLFNVAYGRSALRSEAQRFFGGYVSWGMPRLRLSRWSVPFEQYPHDAAFASLERTIGWPVLQGALKVLAASAREAPLNRERAITVISDAAGQDLKWLFDLASHVQPSVDYALSVVESVPMPEPCPTAGCVRTRVEAARRGAAFRNVPLQVTFEDGQQAIATWDGDAAQQTFEFDSPTPARVARLDPDGTLMLDPTRQDHTRYVSSESNVPLTKWMARWVVWLQDVLLTSTMLL